MNNKLKLLLSCGLLLTTALANASHFRGGIINASVDDSGVVTLEQTSFWRKGYANDFGTGILNRVAWEDSVGGSATLGSAGATPTSFVDTSDARFDTGTETSSFQLPGAGLYSYSFETCCRVSGTHNASSSNFDMEGAIYWDGSTANAPILFDFASVSNEVIKGLDYDQNLNAVGVNLAYNQTNNTGINNQPTGFTIDPVTGQMHIDAADTANYVDSSADGADYAFSGNIAAEDGSFVQIDWVLDLVTSASNLAPNIADIVINGLVGDTFSGVLSGIDPEGDALTWFQQSLIGAGINASNFTFDALTQAFTFDSVGLSAGSYIANIGASDGSLNGFGSITFNLTNATTNVSVPAPAALALMLIAGFGVRLSRKSK